MKKQLTTLLLALCSAALFAAPKVYYVAPDGNDSGSGSKEAPFKTFGKAYSTMAAGDTAYFRGGTYVIDEAEIMTPGSGTGSYSFVFDINKTGTADARTVFAGYPGERPIFDFQNVKPQSRISAFYLHGSYLHLKNFDIIGVQATMHGHYQCECISARNGSNCIVENISMHDNMAIGYYAIKGSNNLVKNCDAYNNYDDYSAFKTDEDYNNYKSTGTVANTSETLGGNCDGFGIHLINKDYTGNRFEGCRAWWNSDDGFDCINNQAAVVWDHCWAFYNGFEPNSSTARGDGNGFKAGGYGMSIPCSGYATDGSGNPLIPQNTISYCVAYENKANGFYSNHHLGGNIWKNNTAIYNGVGSSSANYNMVNRSQEDMASTATDVAGYGHTIENCVSYLPTGTSGALRHWSNIGETCTLTNNASIDSQDNTAFVDGARKAWGTAGIELMADRKADGSLPDITSFMVAKAGGSLFINNQGALFQNVEDYISENTFLKFTEAKTWTEDYVQDKFLISTTQTTSYNAVKAKAATYSDDDETINFTHYNAEVCGNPTTSSTTTGRYIKFFVKGPCTIDVFAESASSTDRDVYITEGSYGGSTTPLASGSFTQDKVSKLSYEYTGEYSGAMYIYSPLGAINLYGVRITYPQSATETVPVFITAGQSNTAGRCMNDNLPDYIKALGEANSGAYQYCNWSYTNGSTRLSESEGVFRKFWPEMESANNSGRFAYDAILYYWIEKALQKDFYVVKHAMGGTSIDPTCTSSKDYHWSADATWLSENTSCNDGGLSMLKALCSNIEKSIDAIEAAGKSADIKAIVWHQGESDRTGTGPDGYHDNLQAVVKYIRDYLVDKTGDAKYATLPFICGTVPPQSKQYNKKVYDALFTLAEEDANFHVIKTEPGTFIGDDLHFDANCAERLGIGMYNKMVELNIIDGEAQAVPEVVYPEGQPITLDFKTWATENVGEKSIQKALTLSGESIKALDGTTDLYKAVGCEADGDFSEFAETFALSTNDVNMRGSVGLQLVSNKVVTFSILNLNPGDGVTITFGAGSAGTTTLAALSENFFVSDDATQTVLPKGTALTSSSVTYIVKSGTQMDLIFGSTGGHYINTIVITPDMVEIQPEASAPIVHMCGDSMMSIYGDESTDTSANDTYTQGMRGWGQFFQDYFTEESGIVVQDWAHTGTTAKGFYSGANYWPVVMGTNTMSDAYKAERPYVKDFVPVKAGDYVIMCWGHNDQKGGSLHNGYKTLDESEYITYITKMVQEVQAKGAYPILATSICRSLFSGKTLTRLGKIDACEAAGETHQESDDPFNYPEAMRQLASSLGIPCIDLNLASQTLWEEFGPGLTASVFFEGVGTTHTAEKGARAMGIAANLTIRGWDTTLSMYSDYATLQNAMRTDVEQYKKEDYASAETTVATETVWTFAKSVDGTTTYNSGDVIASALLDYNGLYMRAYGTHTMTAATPGVSKVVFTLADNSEKEIPVTMAASSAGNTNFVSNIPETAGTATSNYSDRAYAINTAGAGKLYVSFYCTGNGTEANPRYVRMSFNGNEIEEVRQNVTSKNKEVQLAYHGNEAGTYCFWSEPTSQLLAVYYVPDTDSSEDDMHEDDPSTMIVSPTESQQVSKPVKFFNGKSIVIIQGDKAYRISGVETAARRL